MTMMNYRSTVRIHSRSIIIMKAFIRTLVYTLFQVLSQWFHQEEVLVMTQVSPQQDMDHQIIVVRYLFIAEEHLEKEKARLFRSILTKLNAPEEIVNLAPKIACISCRHEESMQRLRDLDKLPSWSVKLIWKWKTLLSPSMIRKMRERAITCQSIIEEEFNMVLDYLVPNWKDMI